MENAISVKTDKISFNNVRRGKSPTAQKSSGSPIKTVTIKNMIISFHIN